MKVLLLLISTSQEPKHTYRRPATTVNLSLQLQRQQGRYNTIRLGLGCDRECIQVFK